MSLEESLHRVLLRQEELGVRLSEEAGGGEKFVRMSREYAELSPVVEAIENLKQAQQELIDLEQMLADESDAEMRAMAQSERDAVAARLPELEHQIKLQLIPKDEADARNAILEVRAGYRVAMKLRSLRVICCACISVMPKPRAGRVEVLSMSDSEIGGIKEAQAMITGRDVFSRLKFESGVHRVQRVPVTESGGRIHTSAATVAVLPEAEEVDIRIEDKDLRIDTYRASGGRWPARQQDRQCRAHHPFADWCGRRSAGREVYSTRTEPRR